MEFRSNSVFLNMHAVRSSFFFYEKVKGFVAPDRFVTNEEYNGSIFGQTVFPLTELSSLELPILVHATWRITIEFYLLCIIHLFLSPYSFR